MSQMLTRTICADLIVPSMQDHATRDDAGALNAMASLNLRRLLDVIVATAIVVFLLPLLAVISLTIFLSSPGPVVFRQRRIGKDGHAFSCWKFRTMVTDAEERLAALLSSDPQARAEWAKDHKLRYDPRVTVVGRLLRKSSLDELPQLFNVLSGTMSLVGPRPIVLAECSRYGRHFADYCAVLPGITGLWQISGRNDVSYRRRIACDVLYSRRQSVMLNCAILALTIPRVVMRSGAY